MYLKNINEIKEEGTTVFMPSGIQATIFNENGEVVVKYFNLTEDRYSKEEFDKLIEEGIFIFNDRPTTQVMECFNEAYIRVENIDGKIAATLVKDGEDIETIAIGIEEGEELSDDEIREYVRDFVDGDNADFDYMNVQRLDEADENGENTLETFFGLKEDDFKTKADLIKAIEDNTDYDVVSSDNLTLNVKDRTDKNGEETVINLKRQFKEAFNQADFKEGSVYKYVKEREQEYLTQEFKLELLQCLDKIAREFPDVEVRQSALGIMDEVGLQEYYDIPGTLDFVNKYLPILNRHVVESLEEKETPSILVKGKEIKLEDDMVTKEDDEMVYFNTGEIEADDELFQIEVTCFVEQNFWDFKVIYEDINGMPDDEIRINKANSYLTATDKEIIKNFVRSLYKKDIKESLQEAGSGLENISNDLQDGKKEGYDPVEFGNWICSTSLDEKWNALTDGMKAYILNKIGIEVLAELEQEDLELNFDYNVLLNNDLDSNDLESLDVFDDLDILDMINGEDKINMYISYKIEHDNKIKDENETPVKSDKKKLTEEYGEYQGILDEVASDIERYNNSNDGSFDAEGFSYEWGPLTINGETWEELGLENEQAKEWIRHEIAMPVKDGHDYYRGLDCILVLGESELKDYYLDEECAAKEEFIADMVKLGCDEETLRDAIQYIQENGDKDRSDCKEVEWWIDYDINLKEVDTEEWYVVNCDGERVSDYFYEEEEAQDECDQMNDSEYTQDKPYEVRSTVDESLKENYDKEWYIVNAEGEVVTDFYDKQEEANKDCERMNTDADYADNAPYTVEERDLDESFKLKDKKKKKKKLDDSLNKEEKGMKKMHENAFKVYNSIEGKECGTFNSWNDVESYLNQAWGSYSASMTKENPQYGSEEDKDNFFNNFTFDIIEVPVEVVVADAEVEETPAEETVEIEVEPEVNQDIADAQSNGEYVEIDGVTADPEKAEVVDTLIFSPEEGKVIADLEPGEKALLPNEQPDKTQEYDNVGSATEIIKADMDDVSDTKEEIISKDNDIEEYIALLLDEEPADVCPDCGCEPCECEQPIAEDLDLDEFGGDALTKADVKKQNAETSIDEAEDKLIKDEWYKVKGYPLSLQYIGEEGDMVKFKKADGIEVLLLKDNKFTKQTYEAFQDNMGMLTNVQDLDMPDALADTIDAKDDGTLYKLSDLAKEIEELKANFQKEIDDFKAELKDELKTALSDLKTDIKDDVKDIQTDVTSKLDNTDSRIADLTAEEEELEAEGEEELDLENEEPAEEETPAEETEEEEQVEESYNGLSKAEIDLIAKQCIQNPMYEQIKDVIRGSKLPGKKMSVSSIAEKLREDYGINTKVDMVMENVITICEYTPVKKYIIDENEEKRLTKDENLGIAKSFLRTGLDTVWAANREAQNMQNLAEVKQQRENLEQAKKEIDKVATQGEAGKKKAKIAAEILTDNEQEAEEAYDYAVNKFSESYDASSILKGTKGILSDIALGNSDLSAFSHVKK